MRMRREILIETQEVWIVCRRRSINSWCQTCCKRVTQVTTEDAAHLAGVSLEGIQQYIETGNVHSSVAPDGQLTICLNSLLEGERR
jgi:hypothetical protein